MARRLDMASDLVEAGDEAAAAAALGECMWPLQLEGGPPPGRGLPADMDAGAAWADLRACAAGAPLAAARLWEEARALPAARLAVLLVLAALAALEALDFAVRPAGWGVWAAAAAGLRGPPVEVGLVGAAVGWAVGRAGDVPVVLRLALCAAAVLAGRWGGGRVPGWAWVVGSALVWAQVGAAVCLPACPTSLKGLPSLSVFSSSLSVFSPSLSVL
jgi:hypothetical protein